MNVLHIIGNGFDLNQGLPTSYAHFYEYYLHLMPQKTDSDAVLKLRKKLYEKLSDKETDRWSDLEKTLGELTIEFETESEFIDAYLDIYHHMLDYMKTVYDNSEVMKFDKVEGTIYHDLAMPWKYLVARERIEVEKSLPLEYETVSIINFNYTDTLNRLCDLKKFLGKLIGQYDNRNIIYNGCLHVHHKLENNDILLGVDNPAQILNEKLRGGEELMNYLIKPQTNVEMGNMVDTRCVELIRNARIISIYGMSIGETDTTWWKEIGNRLMKDNSVRVLYYPFISNIDSVLPIQMPILRREQLRNLCKFLNVKPDDVKGRVFVNFCNLKGIRNIFTNDGRKDVKENFKKIMSLFQDKGVIFKSQGKLDSTHSIIGSPLVAKKIVPKVIERSTLF